jgi:hypothetical protein
MMMPGPPDGFALAGWMAENHPDIPVIITSGDDEKRRSRKSTAASGSFPNPTTWRNSQAHPRNDRSEEAKELIHYHFDIYLNISAANIRPGTAGVEGNAGLRNSAHKERWPH